ncbi:efflux RND transporter periplasmic adaptor subunit [Thiocapsa roseopersicina]|uniref:Membrane fusion protein, multidrug efflux system n=1 Tax=Thiocapsa roseopersicina TaxID=1058 RepID=A0A1H2QTW6_THIRO|nr:efflux RND transporter periplasmic adaptor subunit [Thiocapsa roseopersicina]SDW10310.1 membrane fusion protein, multidrug efflux system [Thiocapsa roseopersicina]
MGSAPRHIGIARAWPIGLVLLLAGCNQTPGSGAAPAAPPPPEVGTITIVARPTTLTTELPGRTVPYRIAEVRPRVSGLIQDRLFTEGGEISAGQVLYQIDPAVYQAAYDSAEAALARSQATLDRARLKADRYALLAKSKAVSQEDNDDTQAALKEAVASVAVDQAALERAQIDLAYSRVESPIAGRIGRSTVTQGALVTANQAEALATVQQIDPIYVDLTQSSTQLLKLRRALADGRLEKPDGEQAKVTLILEDGRIHPHAGRLESSEVTVDQGTGTVTLRATIPNPEQELLPGMFVRARVEEGIRSDAILVPQQGVQHDRRGNPIALVVNDEGKVEERKIETTRTIGDQWLVDAGLEPGDRVIVEGSQKARPGAQVRVMDLSDQPGFAAVN